MNFLPDDIENYANNHTEAEPQVLQSLYRETWQKIIMPRMLSGHLQGRLLSIFSKMMQPKRILEIGAYTGYSAICFAEGLHPKGRIDTVEINEELNSIQDKYWELSGLKDRIQRFNGKALEVIPTLEDSYDMVFIDADKENYLEYYELILPKVRPGGLILIDNVLWTGKVTEEIKGHDPETKALKALNELIQEDDRVSNILLPVRDGIMMAMKK
ncbi:MAG: O-methyltransferase [Flavobacteriales bacterium]|nr:O-methyltransferase [Flavobacteriales bacterium]